MAIDLAIPPITDSGLLNAVGALARAARTYRSVVMILACEPACEPTVMTILENNAKLLALTELIFDTWRQHLDLDAEHDVQQVD